MRATQLISTSEVHLLRRQTRGVQAEAIACYTEYRKEGRVKNSRFKLGFPTVRQSIGGCRLHIERTATEDVIGLIKKRRRPITIYELHLSYMIMLREPFLTRDTGDIMLADRLLNGRICIVFLFNNRSKLLSYLLCATFSFVVESTQWNP